MTLPEVLRVALIRTGSELQQKIITQPHGHGICPQVETVLLAMPAGMSAAACRDIWHQLNEKPFDLIIDGRDKDPCNPDLGEIVGDGAPCLNSVSPGNPGACCSNWKRVVPPAKFRPTSSIAPLMPLSPLMKNMSF